MKIQRTIPPTAALLRIRDIFHGICGFVMPRTYLHDLESSLKSFFGVKHVFLVSSGKAAFTLILQSISALVPDKKDVIIPAYTCFSVPSAIVKSGLRVSPCDIDSSTFDFDYHHLQHIPAEKALCIVPSHLFGMPSDMHKVRQFAKEHNVFVVEDSAQAMGGRLGDELLGTIGDVGFFSLGRGKNVTCMSGGIVVTNNDMIAREIKKRYADLSRPTLAEDLMEIIKAVLLSLFIRPSLYWLPAGLPFLGLGKTIYSTEFPIRKLSRVQAGLMSRWQERLKKSNDVRKENGSFYSSALKTMKPCTHANPFLRFPYLCDDSPRQNEIYRNLKDFGVGLMYPSSINKIEELRDQFEASAYPTADSISSRLLTLPTHELTSMSDRQKIVQSISRASHLASIPELMKCSPQSTELT